MLLAQNPATMIGIVIIGLAILMAVVAILKLSRVFSLWMQAYLSSTPVSILDILAMQLRKVDPHVVVRALIMTKQSGVVVSREELERAYLQGVNLHKLTLAMIQAKEQEMQLTFGELVDAELHDRLAEKLNLTENRGPNDQSP